MTVILQNNFIKYYNYIQYTNKIYNIQILKLNTIYVFCNLSVQLFEMPKFLQVCTDYKPK